MWLTRNRRKPVASLPYVADGVSQRSALITTASLVAQPNAASAALPHSAAAVLVLAR